MAKQKTYGVEWLDDASEDDYVAATHYLRLVEKPKNVTKIVLELRTTGVTEFKAADLLRAAQLVVPKSDDRPTHEQVKKIKNNEVISPVLLIRVNTLKRVVIADGFHRVSAAFRIDPDVALHCNLVSS